MPPLLRPLILALVGLLFTCTASLAVQTRYVTDELHVTVRSGPSVENKVIAVVKSGDVISVGQRKQDGWVEVNLDGGRTGWMIERYLVDQMPATLRLKNLDPQNQTLLSQVEQLTAQKNQLQGDLRAANTKADNLDQDYTQLKEQSGGVLKLQAQYKKLKKLHADQAAKVEQLTTEVESLRFGNNLKWFLAGAGVLLLGWLIGLIMGRRKRRQASNLY